MLKVRVILCGLCLLVSGYANATVLQITGTSAANGKLGWFAVDDAVLAADPDKWLYASQFVNFNFADPSSSLIFNPANVLVDTGRTIFSQSGGIWTVTGGAGDSLTNTLGQGVWIAGTSYLSFNGGGASYSDVSWDTTVYTPGRVPEPATLALIGLGLAGLGFRKKNKLNNSNYEVITNPALVRGFL